MSEIQTINSGQNSLELNVSSLSKGVYLVSLGCAGLTLALLMDFLKSCKLVFTGDIGDE